MAFLDNSDPKRSKGICWYLLPFVGISVGTQPIPRGCTNMPLSDSRAKAAKPGKKLYKLSDGGGLQLWVWPDGAKRWRLAYRFNTKQKVLALSGLHLG